MTKVRNTLFQCWCLSVPLLSYMNFMRMWIFAHADTVLCKNFQFLWFKLLKITMAWCLVHASRTNLYTIFSRVPFSFFLFFFFILTIGYMCNSPWLFSLWCKWHVNQKPPWTCTNSSEDHVLSSIPPHNPLTIYSLLKQKMQFFSLFTIKKKKKNVSKSK